VRTVFLRYQKALSDLGVRKAFREQFKGLQLPVRQRLDEHRIIGRLQGPRTSFQIQRPLADARDSLWISFRVRMADQAHGSRGTRAPVVAPSHPRRQSSARSLLAPQSARLRRRRPWPAASGRWHAALRPSTAADATRAGGAERSGAHASSAASVGSASADSPLRTASRSRAKSRQFDIVRQL